MYKKLISFDLDQTLVETTRAHSSAFRYAFQKKGIKVNEKVIWPFIDGRYSEEVILSIAKKIKIKLNEEQVTTIKKLHHFFLRKTHKYAKPISGAEKTLKELKKRYDLALLTNCAKEEAYFLIKASKIPKKFFDIIVLADQVKHPKPFPDGILKAEHLLHVKSDIHVGDSIYDVLAAKRAKAISIAVLTGQASRSKLKKYKPDYIINSVADLSNLMKKID